ncbi:myb-like protein V [Aphidius gifuensis]|uniref:myb-like protein V n=1 Tax=Aphidius gifuensis TaxID=684658 RepID=UPI001CDCFC4A|nr:myb-like protein V [Aphidius gifuensis]
MDNSDSKDETLWRSIDSDSDNPDESNGTIFFDLPDDDQVYFDARKSSFRGDKTIGETGLLDAMRDLKIKSAIKLKPEQEKRLSIDNKVSINLENVMNIEDAPNEQDKNEKQAVEDVKSPCKIQENIQLEAKINSQTEAILLEEKKIIVAEEVTLDEPEQNLESEKISANIIEAEKIILTGSEKNSTAKEKIPVDENKICQQEKTPKAIVQDDVKQLDEAIKTADKIASVEKTKIHQKNLKQAESSLKKCNINLAQTKKILNDCPKVPLVFSSSMVKAMKPLLQQPSKKPSTIPITPKLLSSSRNRTVTKSIGALTQPKSQLTNNKPQCIIRKSMATSGSILKRQNSNITNTADKSTTTSIKKNPQKLNTTVSTITTTKDGMKLKEEKINNFSIPVTVNRKKRTEFVPFNFSSREKINKPKIIDDKKIDNTKINLSKENKSNNIMSSRINLQKKNQERRDIDEKIKKRQLESKKVHDDVVVKKIAEKKNEDIELRKKSIVKPTIMPNFKIPTGLRVKNNSTVSSCAIKNKRV